MQKTASLAASGLGSAGVRRCAELMGFGYPTDIRLKIRVTRNPHGIFLACFDGELLKQLSSSRPPTINDAEPL